MLALLAALVLGVSPRAWAVHPGCDSLCSHQNVTLSCRVRIRWSMEHTTFRDEPNPCGLAREHVLDLCPSCAACSPESLGDDCREAIQARVRGKAANGSEEAAGALQNSSGNDSAENASARNVSSTNSSGHPTNASNGKSGGQHGKSASSNTTNATNATTGTARKSTTNTTSTTITTTTTTSETFCCSAALDDGDFCGTCWENAPMMSDTFCRTSKENCETCGHKWCNHSAVVKPSCKAYGCIPFKPFNECQCNPECKRFGSCCDDFEDVCEKEDKTDEEEVPEQAPHSAGSATGADAPSPQTSWSDDVIEDAKEVVQAMSTQGQGHHGGHHGEAAHKAEKKPTHASGMQPGLGATQPGLSGKSAVPRGGAGLLPEARVRPGAGHAWLALALGLVVSGVAVVARRRWWQWAPVATSQASSVLPLAPAEE
ncbi:unnamed protein product [Prorocentrum cordatum]|uniref:SMB domain-containing protein n=1 Tax=Prorocentrum cordatum TaxID=2364126 RepID=A0ABN9WAM6_9DINO|nr:unnamed protein product [Polarella glacialis]